MSFNITNIAFVIKHNGSLYYFYTWTSDEYFYEKKSLCVNYYGTILYVPCIPVDNEILKNFSHTIRVKFNNSLYSFLGANKSLVEHQTKMSDVFRVRSISYFDSDGNVWKKAENIFSITVTTAQRVGMRYKYYLRQLSNKEAYDLGYLFDSNEMNLGDVQYAGYSTFGGIKHYLSREEEKYTQELVNSEQTANLIGGTYIHSWTDVLELPPERTAIGFHYCNIACYRITGDAMNGYMDFTISYNKTDYDNNRSITFYNNGSKQNTSNEIDVNINYSTLSPIIK